MKKYKWFVGLLTLLAVILTTGCVQQTQEENPTAEPANILVVYSIGSGWTGWRETLTIHEDGSVVFEVRESNQDDWTTESTQLSDEEIQGLKQFIVDANVFDFEDKYDCGDQCPTDLPSSYIQFIIDGKEKTISMYVPQDMPETLEQILEKIGSIAEQFR